MSERVVVTDSSIFSVIPEYLTPLASNTKQGQLLTASNN